MVHVEPVDDGAVTAGRQCLHLHPPLHRITRGELLQPARDIRVGPRTVDLGECRPEALDVSSCGLVRGCRGWVQEASVDARVCVWPPSRRPGEGTPSTGHARPRTTPRGRRDQGFAPKGMSKGLAGIRGHQRSGVQLRAQVDGRQEASAQYGVHEPPLRCR